MYAKLKQAKYRKEQVINNTNKLFTKKKKILLAGHSYNIHDKYLTNEIIKYLKTKDYEIIYSDFFDYEKVKNESKKLTNNLYWKKNKEYIGAIKYSEEYVDLILTISTFPCSNDLLVNDFIKNKIKKPILNLIIDDINSMTGIITRLESFIDINE
jgi:predicted nucleotide-binding protein (sugar kinase/HSP70/actin superfamily)